MMPLTFMAQFLAQETDCVVTNHSQVSTITTDCHYNNDKGTDANVQPEQQRSSAAKTQAEYSQKYGRQNQQKSCVPMTLHDDANHQSKPKAGDVLPHVMGRDIKLQLLMQLYV